MRPDSCFLTVYDFKSFLDHAFTDISINNAAEYHLRVELHYHCRYRATIEGTSLSTSSRRAEHRAALQSSLLSPFEGNLSCLLAAGPWERCPLVGICRGGGGRSHRRCWLIASGEGNSFLRSFVYRRLGVLLSLFLLGLGLASIFVARLSSSLQVRCREHCSLLQIFQPEGIPAILFSCA